MTEPRSDHVTQALAKAQKLQQQLTAAEKTKAALAKVQHDINEQAENLRFVRMRELPRITGWAKSTLYLKISQGKFPRLFRWEAAAPAFSSMRCWHGCASASPSATSSGDGGAPCAR